MIPLGQLLLYFDILIQLCLFWEGNSINSLQIIIILISKPISRRVLCDFETLNLVC